jgi:hypothetical protein
MGAASRKMSALAQLSLNAVTGWAINQLSRIVARPVSQGAKTARRAMSKNNMNTNHEYIGDGVYASFDGYQIWLHLNSHDSQPLIALDMYTMAHLIGYAKRLQSSPNASVAARGEALDNAGNIAEDEDRFDATGAPINT